MPPVPAKARRKEQDWDLKIRTAAIANAQFDRPSAMYQRHAVRMEEMSGVHRGGSEPTHRYRSCPVRYIMSA